MTANATFSDHPERSRFELDVGGEVATADYARRADRLVIFHVYAPPALRGTGAAGRLMGEVAGVARAEGLRIAPLCGYAASWLRAHADHRDLITG